MDYHANFYKIFTIYFWTHVWINSYLDYIINLLPSKIMNIIYNCIIHIGSHL